MTSKFALSALAAALAALLAGCSAPAEESAVAATDTPALRFAVLGDGEPKPDPVFPGFEAAVADVNRLAEQGQVDFVIGVGDLAHKGTVVQYEAITPVLQRLTRPFFPIMGNEEHNESTERYLDYARRWNADLPGVRYVQDRGPVAIVYASPDTGREFADESVDWMLEQLKAANKPVFLVVHSAQTGAYPENAEKGVANPRFAEVLAQPNLAAVISGDLHMDMARVIHSKQIGRVHYLHIPGLERTKIPDETNHTPMFRTFTVSPEGEVLVQTYRTGTQAPLKGFDYRFSLAPFAAPAN